MSRIFWFFIFVLCTPFGLLLWVLSLIALLFELCGWNRISKIFSNLANPLYLFLVAIASKAFFDSSYCKLNEENIVISGNTESELDWSELLHVSLKKTPPFFIYYASFKNGKKIQIHQDSEMLSLLSKYDITIIK